MNVKISNICARFSTNCKLNLEDIFSNDQYLIFSSKKYQKNKFSALIAKYKETNLTLLIFSTGTVVLVGGKSEKQLSNCSADFVFLLRRLSLETEACVKNFRITNYCCSANFGKNIDLNKLATDYPMETSYETEIFVSAKFNQLNEDSKRTTTFTVTHKGHVFCTGITDSKLIDRQFGKLYETLKPFFKVNKNSEQ